MDDETASLNQAATKVAASTPTGGPMGLLAGILIGVLLAGLGKLLWDMFRSQRQANAETDIEQRRKLRWQWVASSVAIYFIVLTLFVMWFSGGEFDWPSISSWITPETEFVAVDGGKSLREIRIEEVRNLFGVLVFVVGGFAGAIQIGNSLHRTHLLQLEKYANQERLNADIFAKASEHLGAKEIATRLGAVSSLETLARSDQEGGGKFLTDQIMETLASFVRERSVVEHEKSKIALEADVNAEPHDVPADIAAAVAALTRSYPPSKRPQLDKTAEYAGKGGVDLKRSYLVGLRLFEGTDLTQFNLSGASLQNSSLYGCNMDGVWLSGADLTNARIENSSIAGTYFYSQWWQGTKGLTQGMLDSAMEPDTPPILPEGLQLRAGQTDGDDNETG